MPNIIHSGSGVNIMTLPDQVTNLACVGGTDGTAGTIDVSFTEVPASSWGLLQNYLLVYKAGSIPQTPFDGTRIVLPKGTAGAQKTYQITGLTFDQLYGVRIYPISTRYQHQTAAEGATATATPVNGITISSLTDGVNPDRVKVNSTVEFWVLKHNYENSGGTLVARRYLYATSIWNLSNINTYANSTVDTLLNGTYYNAIEQKVKNQIITVSIPYTIGNNNSSLSVLSRNVFIGSITEYGLSSSNANIEGAAIPYFNTSERRKGYLNGTATDKWTRTADKGIGPQYAFYIPAGAEQRGTHPTNYAMGIQPWFVLNANMLFSPIPDSDGCYIPI